MEWIAWMAVGVRALVGFVGELIVDMFEDKNGKDAKPGTDDAGDDVKPEEDPDKGGRTF